MNPLALFRPLIIEFLNAQALHCKAHRLHGRFCRSISISPGDSENNFARGAIVLSIKRWLSPARSIPRRAIGPSWPLALARSLLPPRPCRDFSGACPRSLILSCAECPTALTIPSPHLTARCRLESCNARSSNFSMPTTLHGHASSPSGPSASPRV